MSPVKVVIFEDEALLANDLKQQIQKYGYEVVAIFRKAEDGLKFFREVAPPSEIPDVVLMDISLAGTMTGIDAARILLQEYNFALVFLTGMSQMDIFEEAFKIKPHAFLVKPFDIQQAVVSIRLALDQRTLTDRLLRCNEELRKKEAESSKKS